MNTGEESRTLFQNIPFSTSPVLCAHVWGEAKNAAQQYPAANTPNALRQKLPTPAKLLRCLLWRKSIMQFFFINARRKELSDTHSALDFNSCCVRRDEFPQHFFALYCFHKMQGELIKNSRLWCAGKTSGNGNHIRMHTTMMMIIVCFVESRRYIRISSVPLSCPRRHFDRHTRLILMQPLAGMNESLRVSRGPGSQNREISVASCKPEIFDRHPSQSVIQPRAEKSKKKWQTFGRLFAFKTNKKYADEEIKQNSARFSLGIAIRDSDFFLFSSPSTDSHRRCKAEMFFSETSSLSSSLQAQGRKGTRNLRTEWSGMKSVATVDIAKESESRTLGKATFACICQILTHNESERAQS